MAHNTFNVPLPSGVLYVETRCNEKQSSNPIKGFTAADICSVEPDPPYIGPIKLQRYTLVHDLGVELPRERWGDTMVTQQLGCGSMGRMMRMLLEFKVLALAANRSTKTAPIAEKTSVECYRYLELTEYLATVGHGNGVDPSNSEICYWFIPTRHTGPLPPIAQRNKVLYDVNLGKIV